jgi:hypothetical protein
MGPNYLPGKKEHLFSRKKILGMIVFAGRRQEPVESVSVLCIRILPYSNTTSIIVSSSIHLKV